MSYWMVGEVAIKKVIGHSDPEMTTKVIPPLEASCVEWVFTCYWLCFPTACPFQEVYMS